MYWFLKHTVIAFIQLLSGDQWDEYFLWEYIGHHYCPGLWLQSLFTLWNGSSNLKKNVNSNPLSDIKVTRYESFVVHPINVELCPWEPEEWQPSNNDDCNKNSS